jgi:hypothetical protein
MAMFEVRFWNGDDNPSVVRFSARKAAVKHYHWAIENRQCAELSEVLIRSWRVAPPQIKPQE